MVNVDQPFENHALGYDTLVDSTLQSEIETIDDTLRAKYDITPKQTAVGVLDLKTLKLAMIHPD